MGYFESTVWSFYPTAPASPSEEPGGAKFCTTGRAPLGVSGDSWLACRRGQNLVLPPYGLPRQIDRHICFSSKLVLVLPLDRVKTVPRMAVVSLSPRWNMYHSSREWPWVKWNRAEARRAHGRKQGSSAPCLVASPRHREVYLRIIPDFLPLQCLVTEEKNGLEHFNVLPGKTLRQGPPISGI